MPARSATWLRRPVSQASCIVAWFLASLLFLGMVYAWGGHVMYGDSETVNPAAASIAHGEMRCAFAQSYDPPLYELLAAGYAATLDLGSAQPFPATGPRESCARAAFDVEQWSILTHENLNILNAGYLAWPVLLAGFVALLRVAGFGRTRVETVGVCALALTPQVSFCLNQYFHPEQLLALGFGLGAVACAVSNRWALAGLLAGLALTSHQLGLLVVVVLLVVAPRRAYARLIAACVLTVAVICVPLIVLSDGQAIHGMVFNGFPLHLPTTLLSSAVPIRGFPLVVISRAPPFVVPVVVGVLLRRRIGDAVATPFVIMGLLALAAMLRMLFDTSVWGYYFAWSAVTLLMLDLLTARLRAATVAWIIGVALLYPPLPVVDSFSVVHPVAAEVLVMVPGLALAIVPLWRIARRSVPEIVGAPVAPSGATPQS